MNFVINVVIPALVCIGILIYGYHHLKKVREGQKQAGNFQKHPSKIQHEEDQQNSPKAKPDSFSKKNVLLRLIFLIIGVFGILFFLVSLPASIAELRTANQALHWPTVKGEVVVSNIVSGSTGGKSLHVRANVRYRYTVKEKDYISGNIDSVGYAQAGIDINYVKKYPKGKQVSIYYNPDNPAQAILEPQKIKKTGYSALLIGFIFLLIGICSVQVYRGKIRVGHFPAG